MSNAPFRDSNLIDAANYNWRAIAYPAAALLFLILGGLGIYFYLLSNQSDKESAARNAFVQATTPEAKLKVVDQFPGTDNGLMALLSAADDYFVKKDYPNALAAYQRALNDYPHHDLRDTAQLGLAASLEASGKVDDALTNYLEVAHRGTASAYAPFAYTAAIRLEEARGDKASVKKLLMEESALDPTSSFSQDAAEKLKTLSAP